MRGSGGSGSEAVAPGAGQGPTIEDVAELACVSTSSARNFFSRPAVLSAGTLARIDEAVRVTGYAPRGSSGRPWRRPQARIGFELPRAEDGEGNPVFGQLLIALLWAARSAGFALDAFVTDKEPGSRVPYYLERWRRGELGGFVVTDADYDDERVPWLRHAGVPFVMVGRLRETAGYCWVDNDNQTGSVMAVRHLVEHGHRRIAYLGWPGRDPVADRRLAGYRQGMRAAGLLELVEVQDYGQVAVEQAHRLLAAPEGSRPTAVVASCDEFAYDAIRAGRERGLPIGGDPDSGLAVVGCDDSPLASRTTPSLTTLRQPVALLAERAAELLEARMADRRFEGHALEPPRLVVRESSRGGTSAPVGGAELPLGLRRPLGGSAIADEPPELGGIRMIADG